MPKLAALLSLVLIGGLIWISSLGDPHPKVAGDGYRPAELLSGFEPSRGRVLYVVVDSDGVYLGTKRFDVEAAKTAVRYILKEQRIRNLMIFGTDLARYGDAIELYGSIDRASLDWCNFSFRTVPIGTRKPLTGFYARRSWYSEDVENRSPDDDE